MSKITEYTGILTYVDEDGNENRMYPEVKTDASLTTEGKAADAAAVGAELKKVLYIESFDSSTGTLVTKSADYTG